MNRQMRKALLSIFIIINLTKAYDRRGTVYEADFRTLDETQGLTVRRLNNNAYEFLYTEEFNADTNPLKLNFNYFFEKSGSRQIVEVDNICGDYKYGTPEYAAQHFVLEFLAETKECPIKKGTRFVFRTGRTYQYSNTFPSCGISYGFVSIFRTNTTSGQSPLVLLFNYRGLITGNDCQ
ncbi:uncharacterized protein LOC122505584 [Leptopilina heterotoma]|uniref:uncharacterized protein LOC122505584 n=1 Tax=Leptopilina heterotoma TaxID=63436 RepID=UPI001CA90E5F|nr:uncharacterized protein LOC122505584 [Leptopilina heterotoma]